MLVECVPLRNAQSQTSSKDLQMKVSVGFQPSPAQAGKALWSPTSVLLVAWRPDHFAGPTSPSAGPRKLRTVNFTKICPGIRSSRSLTSSTTKPLDDDNDDSSPFRTVNHHPKPSARMGRLHSNGKGISASAIPYSRNAPSWLKTTPDQVVDQICKLAKKGATPSQIGVILRDSHGIAQVKVVTGMLCYYRLAFAGADEGETSMVEC